MKKKIIITLISVFCTILVWSGIWGLFAYRAIANFDAELASLKQVGYEILYSSRQFSGYPFSVRLELKSPEIIANQSDDKWLAGHWRVESATISIPIISAFSRDGWSKSTVSFSGVQIGGFRFLGFDFAGAIESHKFVISFDKNMPTLTIPTGTNAPKSEPPANDAAPIWRATITGEGVQYDNGLAEQALRAKTISAQITAYAPDGKNSLGESINLAFKITDGQLLVASPDQDSDESTIDSMTEATAETIAAFTQKNYIETLAIPINFSGKLSVMGNFPPGAIEESLNNWRVSGGFVNLTAFNASMNSEAIQAAGTFALDRQIRLIGTLVVSLPPLARLMKNLYDWKAITPATGESLQKFLTQHGDLTKSPPHLSITIQDGVIASPRGGIMPLPEFLSIDTLSTDEE